MVVSVPGFIQDKTCCLMLQILKYQFDDMGPRWHSNTQVMVAEIVCKYIL